MALFDLLPFNLSTGLNILAVVLGLILLGLVLRLVARVTRAVFTVGCLGIGALAVVLVVVVYIARG